MKPDDDDFAALVIAQSFQLVNGAGQVVAELGIPTPPIISGVTPQAALVFDHLDPAVTDSALSWTQISPPAGAQLLRLQGPVAVGGGNAVAPRVELDRNSTALNTDAATMQAGPRGAALTANARARLTAGNIDAGASLNATAAAGGSATAGLQATDGTSTATLQLGSAASGNISASAGGQIFAQGATVDLRAGTGAFSIFPISGNLDLNIPSGRLRMAASGRNAYLPGDSLQQDLPGSVVGFGTGFAYIDGGGIQFNGRDGDVIWVDNCPRLLKATAGGACVCYPQVFAPSGGLVYAPASRIVSNDLAVGEDATYSKRWRYVLASGTGVYTLRMIAGTTGGTFTAVAPDTHHTLEIWSIR